MPTLLGLRCPASPVIDPTWIPGSTVSFRFIAKGFTRCGKLPSRQTNPRKRWNGSSQMVDGVCPIHVEKLMVVLCKLIRLDKFAPGLKGILGSVMDITERKMNEETQRLRVIEAEERRVEAEEAKRQQELLIDITS